ncbi:MAG: hypothetical protein RLZZ618_3388 [Pseudomonadota bacterium]|jgi:hypothetical protein
MAKLFFVAYGGGHAAMLALVAKQAARNGHEVIFLGLTTARATLAREGVPAIGCAELWAFGAPGAQAFGRELAATLPEGGPVPLAESEAYLGLSFADLVAERGESEARRLYAEEGRHAFLPVGFLQRVLAHYQPAVLVSTNSPRAEQAAILAAGRLGLKSVCLVDLFALQEVRWIGQPGYASKVCVLNEAVRAMFAERGRSDDELVITGNPAFDRLNEAAALHAGRTLRAERGWNDGRITLLWASQVEPARHPFNGAMGDPSLPRRIESVLRRFVAEHPGYRLVVRYHPSEQEVFAAQTDVEFSPCSEPLPVLLQAVDLVVVTASTVGLEASIAGRSVVTVDCSVFTEDAPYSRMGLSTGVPGPEDLPAALEHAALSVRSSEGPARAQAQDANGGATRRVLEVIESLLPDGV